MSHVEGTDELIAKLAVFANTLGALNYELHDREMIRAQQEAVSLIPVDTGQGREALASKEALQRETDSETGETTWSFGMITLAIQRAAKHLFFVEFGTKGYMKGEQRRAGRKKLKGTWRFVSTSRKRDTTRFEYRESVSADGRNRLEQKLIDPQRWKRIKRMVPARPAQPWFRPTQSNLFRRLQDIRPFDDMVRAAKRVARLGDGN